MDEKRFDPHNVSEEDAKDLTDEQKERVLQAGFGTNGEQQEYKPAVNPKYTPKEHAEIQQEIATLYPKTPNAGAPIDVPLKVANPGLVGPPTAAPNETRATHTPVESGSDNTPPAHR